MNRKNRGVIRLVTLAMVLALTVFLAADATAVQPTAYAWARWPNVDSDAYPLSAIGVMGQVNVSVTSMDPDYRFVGAQVGLCASGVASCGTDFIEAGIGKGTGSSNNVRLYVRYDDGGGNGDALWWDTTALTTSIVLVRLTYDAGYDQWKVWRAPCTSVGNCGAPTLVHSFDASAVGFTEGSSVYAGAAGAVVNPPVPLPLGTEISVLAYDNGQGFEGWNWDQSVTSDCHYYTVEKPSNYAVRVRMQSSC
jgi:hypothetical protein